MAVRVDGLAAIVGLGYIVGIKYASIIAAGSFLSFLVFIPFVNFIGQHLTGIIPPGTVPISEMGVDDIFVNYVRLIGIGGIAGAGIMGIIRSIPSIGKSFMLGIKGIASAGEDHEEQRTERNLGMRDVLIGMVRDYYRLHDWDVETGIPSDASLKRLNLLTLWQSAG